MMDVMTIVGARPQFIKAAPVLRAIQAHNSSGTDPLRHSLVHTGQHYDAGMSDVFFDELDLPTPDVSLAVGSGSHAVQTGRMMQAIEALLLDREPAMVVVYGDTNSTLAGALAAAKVGRPVAHVEAGLRSGNRRMPEEINRIVADKVSDLLLCPTATAMDNLATENLAANARFTGDVMYDATLYNVARARRDSRILQTLDIAPARYCLATIHRARNVDTDRLGALLDALEEVAETVLPVVFPVHPRTAARLERDYPARCRHPRLQLTGPLGYLDTLQLLANARVALTDSGGLQKEAFFLGCPCVTLRASTEWPETVEAGMNVLADADPDRILTAVRHWLKTGARPADAGSAASAFGDGRASERVVASLVDYLAGREART